MGGVPGSILGRKRRGVRRRNSVRILIISGMLYNLYL